MDKAQEERSRWIIDPGTPWRIKWYVQHIISQI
jgi:hypothetical protein